MKKQRWICDHCGEEFLIAKEEPLKLIIDHCRIHIIEQLCSIIIRNMKDFYPFSAVVEYVFSLN